MAHYVLKALEDRRECWICEHICLKCDEFMNKKWIQHQLAAQQKEAVHVCALALLLLCCDFPWVLSVDDCIAWIKSIELKTTKVEFFIHEHQIVCTVSYWIAHIYIQKNNACYVKLQCLRVQKTPLYCGHFTDIL